MIDKKTLASLLVVGALAASVSSPALAGGRGGDGAAIAAGILGGVVIGSLIANSQPTYVAPAPQPYYPPQPVYQPAPRVYYEAPPVYYQRPPVRHRYYAAPQPYYAPAPAMVVQGRYRY